MMQRRLGVAEQLERSGSRTIRDFMPDQHREFYRQLPFLLVGAVDSSGAPWATLLSGEPGFVTSPDARTLRIAARPDAGDPVGAALAAGSPVGMLGIELHTRRRNRVNGAVTALDQAGFTVSVGHAFGNCPQYIQTRALAPIGRSRAQSPGPIERAGGLDADAAANIAAADTFFVTSYVDVDGEQSRRAVDTSHRGGRPGFIRIDGNVLTIPDFAGNQYFNTLGNLLLNPRAGLLFVNFSEGSLVWIAATAQILHDGRAVDAYPGAQRVLQLTVHALWTARRRLPLHSQDGEASPFLAGTGIWPG